MVTRMRPRDDAGLGVIEIMVSMSLLSIILMAMAPLLISGMRATANNATMAFASQEVNARIEQARAASGSCGAYFAALAAFIPTAQDGRGVALELTYVNDHTEAACLAGGIDRLQRLTVEARWAEGRKAGDLAATATTVVAVPGITNP